jgi:putative endonuclease
VEVKTRSSDCFGYPEAAVTPKKRAHLMDAAQAFMQTLPDTECDWRIDVIAIRKLDSSKSPEIVHFENAVN